MRSTCASALEAPDGPTSQNGSASAVRGRPEEHSPGRIGWLESSRSTRPCSESGRSFLASSELEQSSSSSPSQLSHGSLNHSDPKPDHQRAKSLKRSWRRTRQQTARSATLRELR